MASSSLGLASSSIGNTSNVHGANNTQKPNVPSSVPSMPNSVPNKSVVQQSDLRTLYMLQGITVDVHEEPQTCAAMSLTCESKWWNGFRVWSSSQASTERWMFFCISSQGTIVRERQQCPYFVTKDVSNYQLGKYFWKDSAHRLCPSDFLYQFDFDRFDLVVSGVIQDKKIISKALCLGQVCCFIGDFVISLVGVASFSMRIKGGFSGNLYDVEKKPVQEKGFIHLTPSIAKSKGVDLRRNVATLLFDLVQSNFQQLAKHEKKNNLIPIDDQLKDFALPIFQHFLETLTDSQRASMTQFKAYFVDSGDMRSRFRAEHNMLREDSISAITDVGFHGIRSNTQKATEDITKHGFRCDASSGLFLYGIGNYVAIRANYSCTGFLEFLALSTSNFKNSLFLCLFLPGRTQDGANASRLPIKRDFESYRTFVSGDELYTLRDTSIIPVVLFKF